jgi:hypothetical protein
MRCRYFIVYGGAGTLHKDLTLGHSMVVASALRDEGTSFHYQPPGRQVEADPARVGPHCRRLARPLCIGYQPSHQTHGVCAGDDDRPMAAERCGQRSFRSSEGCRNFDGRAVTTARLANALTERHQGHPDP